MVSTEALWRRNEKTGILMDREDIEDQYAIQIFTASYESALKALPFVLERKPAIIDINSGCPVNKVVKTGAGSALMKAPQRLADIIKAIKDKTDIPVTVKIRSGWDHNSINFLETGSLAQEAGAAAVGLHPRTRSMAYRGQADWNHITELKESLSIPVLGSGDLFTPEQGLQMLTETGCDGLLFARGAFGNPFIFQRTKHLLLTGDPLAEPDKITKIHTALDHLDLAIQYYGGQGLKEMRKHFCAYTKGVPGGARLRQMALGAQSREDYQDIAKQL